jgi:sortase (surface protein transpeptidase)
MKQKETWIEGVPAKMGYYWIYIVDYLPKGCDNTMIVWHNGTEFNVPFLPLNKIKAYMEIKKPEPFK